MRSKLVTSFVLALAVVLVLGVGANSAQATALSLADLISSKGSLTVGDKIFSDFSYLAAYGQGIFSPSSASQILVSGTVLDPLHEQLTFQGAFNVGFAGGGPASYVDFLIGYTVTTTSGQALIHDIALSFNGILINPLAQATVTETAFVGNTVVGNIFVSSNNPVQLSAQMDLIGGPYSSIRVQKDIQLHAFNENGQAQFSAVNQVISQVSAVPEPASLLLLGSGLVGLGVWARRRKGDA